MQEQAQQYHLLCLFTVLRAPPLYTCENGFYCASVTNAARLSTVQKGAKKDATLMCTPKVRHFWRYTFFMAKKGIKQRKYSAEFKISVILDMREHHLGYRETARKYNLVHQSMGGALYTLHRWERIYLEEGESGFMVERRGRKGGRPKKKLDKSVEEDLIAENQRLKMELEYLKKLSALVLAEEQKSGKKRK